MMRKTTSYYFEKHIGKALAVVFAITVYKNWGSFSIITEKDIFDKLITISATLFGFLLTVLTLIVQSTSESVKNMKRHGSYRRLVSLNKNVVLLYAIISLASIVLFIKSQALQKACYTELQYPSIIVTSLFVWAILDTFVFTLIFYKILLSEDNS